MEGAEKRGTGDPPPWRGTAGHEEGGEVRGPAPPAAFLRQDSVWREPRKRELPATKNGGVPEIPPWPPPRKISGLHGQALGRSLASLVVACRQLWLSQAGVPDADKASLLDAPISPGHTFGPAVEEILQRFHREHEVSQQVAALLPLRSLVWGRSSHWQSPQTCTITRTGSYAFYQRVGYILGPL
ncbi:UNVERIFIED_CONTAM: hypothetical protein FKN15_075363 [Acipenser sinensis]